MTQLMQALIGTPDSIDDAMRGFDRIWWLLVAGGLATSAVSLGLETRRAAA